MTNLQSNPRQKAQEILFAWFRFQRSLGSRIDSVTDVVDAKSSTELVMRLLSDFAAQLENFPDIIAGRLPYQDEEVDDKLLSSTLHQECMGIHIRLLTLYVPTRWINPHTQDNIWTAWKQFCDLAADYTNTKRVYGEFVGNDLSTSQWREILLRLIEPSSGEIFNSPRILRWLGVTSTWVRLPRLSTNHPKSSAIFSPNETDNAFLQRKAHERKATKGPFIKLEDPS